MHLQLALCSSSSAFSCLKPRVHLASTYACALPKPPVLFQALGCQQGQAATAAQLQRVLEDTDTAAGQPRVVAICAPTSSSGEDALEAEVQLLASLDQLLDGQVSYKPGRGSRCSATKTVEPAAPPCHLLDSISLLGAGFCKVAGVWCRVCSNCFCVVVQGIRDEGWSTVSCSLMSDRCQRMMIYSSRTRPNYYRLPVHETTSRHQADAQPIPSQSNLHGLWLACIWGKSPAH